MKPQPSVLTALVALMLFRSAASHPMATEGRALLQELGPQYVYNYTAPDTSVCGTPNVSNETLVQVIQQLMNYRAYQASTKAVQPQLVPDGSITVPVAVTIVEPAPADLPMADRWVARYSRRMRSS